MKSGNFLTHQYLVANFGASAVQEIGRRLRETDQIGKGADPLTLETAVKIWFFCVTHKPSEVVGTLQKHEKAVLEVVALLTEILSNPDQMEGLISIELSKQSCRVNFTDRTTFAGTTPDGNFYKISFVSAYFFELLGLAFSDKTDLFIENSF